MYTHTCFLRINIRGMLHYFNTGLKAPEWLQYHKYPNEVVTQLYR